MPWYAVRSGRVPGLYHSWDSCLQQVHKFPGAIFKKFTSEGEARNFLASGIQVADSPSLLPPPSLPSPLCALAVSPNSYPHFSCPPQIQTQTIPQSIPFTTSPQTQTQTIPQSIPFASSLKSFVAKHCGVFTLKKQMNNHLFYGRRYFRCSLTNCQYKQWEEDFIERNELKNENKCIVKNESVINEYSLTELSEIVNEEYIVLYVDGGCESNGSFSKDSSGWGVAVLHVANGVNESNGKIIAELFGKVITDENNPFYLGAEVETNNTAELTAIGEGLIWLKEYFQYNSFGSTSSVKEQSNSNNKTLKVFIRFDSYYAAKSILKIYNGQKNKFLIDNIRYLHDNLARLKIKSSTSKIIPKYNILFSKVKGHGGNKWNDLADELANKGKLNTCQIGRYYNHFIQSLNDLTKSSNENNLSIENEENGKINRKRRLNNEFGIKQIKNNADIHIVDDDDADNKSLAKKKLTKDKTIRIIFETESDEEK